MNEKSELRLVVRYEEVPDNNDDSEDEFQNKINLGKKYYSSSEPKILIWSVEQLIERFCEQNAYLNGKSGQMSLVRASNVH